MADNVTVPLTGESAAFAVATFLDPQAAAALKLPTSACGYARVASEFLTAFEQLRDEVPMSPRLYLAAQTLECTLKAYIGWADASKLGKPLLGHDLLNLWEMAFDASNVAPIKLSIGRKPPEWCETLATSLRGSMPRLRVVDRVCQAPGREALSEHFTGRDPRIDNRLIFLARMHLAMS